MNEKDTSQDAQEVLLRLYRQMSPATKTSRIFHMNNPKDLFAQIAKDCEKAKEVLVTK